jgi:hypothetical protein
VAGARATGALLALGGAGALLWGAGLERVVRAPLAPGLEAALARALGVERAAVSIGRARLGWPGRLYLDDVTTGEWAATRVEVDVDAWAALGGRLQPERVRARELFCDLGLVDELEATWGRGRARLALRRVTLMPPRHWLGGLEVSLGEVGLDVEGGALKRLAFSGARVGTIDGLAGAALRGPGGWLVRAGRTGLSATARVGLDGAVGKARLERYPLATLPSPRGVDLGAATADGTIDFSIDRGDRSDGARATLDLRVDGVALAHPALARARVDGLAATITGELARADGVLTLRDVRVGVGRAALALDGRIGPAARLELRRRWRRSRAPRSWRRCRARSYRTSVDSRSTAISLRR